MMRHNKQEVMQWKKHGSPACANSYPEIILQDTATEFYDHKG